VRVRGAKSSDVAAVADLLHQLGYSPSLEDLKADVTSGRAGQILVAVAEKAIVGVLALKIHRHLLWGADVASIEALVVDRHVRSRGVGAELVREAITRARAARAILIELHSNGSRKEARRFYEREGFEVTSNYFVQRL